MACKEGQFDVVKLIQALSINLNAQHVNGMTHSVIRKSNPFSFSRKSLLLGKTKRETTASV